MIKAAVAILLMLFNLILYFIFGSLLTSRRRNSRFSVTGTIFAGFFLYYTMFTVCCIPVMMKWRPLSLLTWIWAGVCIAVAVISIILSFRTWKEKAAELSA